MGAASPIEIEVAFTPEAGRAMRAAVHVLIDVVRATSVIVDLVARGARPLLLVGRDEDAARAKAAHPQALVCAEREDGRAAAGADCAPTFASLRAHVVDGRAVVVRSTNGTVAAQAVCARPGVALVGALRNASAVAEAAVEIAGRRAMPVRFVCSGREAGAAFCLDDAYCAGVLVQSTVVAAAARGGQSRLRDSARVARSLVDRYADAGAALADSESGAVLRSIGADADLAHAAHVDATDVVPALTHGDDPRWVVATPLRTSHSPTQGTSR